MFRYTAGLQHLAGGVDNQLRLSVRAPHSEPICVFAEGPLQLPLSLQLDGPSQVRCDAGVDANHNDTLEPNESQFGAQFPLGRVSRLQCGASSNHLNFVSSRKCPTLQSH